jgi:hypothetical protein
MLSGIKKLVQSIKQDNHVLFRSKSLSPLPPSYIYKNRFSRASSLRKSTRRECDVNRLKTVIPTMMYAKIVIFLNDKAYICTIDGNCNGNTLPYNIFYNTVDDCTGNLSVHLEHSIFTLSFKMGKRIVLGRQFIEKYVDTLDYQRGVIILKDTTKLDVYNEIPSNVITLCINNEYFLAHIDATQKHSVLSLEMLDKLQCDTTQTQINTHCIIQTEYTIPFEFDSPFYVIDNHNKYVILGLDFINTHCTRIGKHYILLKQKSRVFYI